MWKDPGAPWAVICSTLFSAVCFLKEGDFSNAVVFQLSLVETYPLVILQRESGGKYIFTSLYSKAQEYLLDLSFELKLWGLSGNTFLLVEFTQPLTLPWEIQKIRYHLIYLCVYMNRVRVVHCTRFKITKCLLRYAVKFPLYLLLSRLFSSYCSPTAHQAVTQLLPSFQELNLFGV